MENRHRLRKLWVNGNFRIYDEANTASRFVINTAGRVGIGTDTPDVLCLLEVIGPVFGEKFSARGTSTAPGGGTAGYLDAGNKIVTGGTNSNNIYPCSFKSAPTNSTTDNSGVLGNYSHYLAQQMNNTAGSSITTQRVFDCSVNLTDTATNTQAYVSRLNIGSNNNFNIYSSGTAPNYFNGNVGIGTTSATEKLHVVGNIRLTGGIVYTDDGTSAGTVDSKLLDDYEEGTFTFQFATGSEPSSESNVSASTNYVKVGNLVTASIRLNWDTISGTNNVRFVLPFPCVGGGSQRAMGTFGFVSQVTTGGNQLASSVTGNGTFVNFFTIVNNGSADSLVYDDLGNNGELQFSITYRTN